MNNLPPTRISLRTILQAGTVLAILTLTVVLNVTAAGALATLVPLGAAEDFALLAGQAITNTGPTVVTGDIGLWPGSQVTGFPPGIVFGEVRRGDEVAQEAQIDLTTAYNNAAGQPPDYALPPDAGGLTLVSGVYAADSLGLTGTLTLDAQGNPGAVWVFQVSSNLITASGSAVNLINGASPCNVFWQIGGVAFLGMNSSFQGSLLALNSIDVGTGTAVNGRLLARNGAVTLDTNQITAPTCGGADLALSKTAPDGPVAANSNLTYALDVVNNGPETATAFTVTDTLPAGSTFVSAGSGCVEGPTGTVTCSSSGPLANGASTSFTITILTGEAGTLTNSATIITSSPADSNSANNSDTTDTVVAAPCDLTATITGTARSESITGTSGPDIIFGLGGDDSIKGLGGDDIICGGDGDDSLSGGADQDRLYGEAGNDKLTGEAGADVLNGGFGSDRLVGGADRDVCHGGAGSDSASTCEEVSSA